MCAFVRTYVYISSVWYDAKALYCCMLYTYKVACLYVTNGSNSNEQRVSTQHYDSSIACLLAYQLIRLYWSNMCDWWMWMCTLVKFKFCCCCMCYGMRICLTFLYTLGLLGNCDVFWTLQCSMYFRSVLLLRLIRRINTPKMKIMFLHYVLSLFLINTNNLHSLPYFNALA